MRSRPHRADGAVEAALSRLGDPARAAGLPQSRPAIRPAFSVLRRGSESQLLIVEKPGLGDLQTMSEIGEM